MKNRHFTKSRTLPSCLVSISFDNVSTSYVVSLPDHNRLERKHLHEIKKNQILFSTETEVYDPEVPLNLSKSSSSSSIWSPARSLENESNYSSPNLPVFNQLMHDPFSSTYGRIRKESNKDDPSKIFPVSNFQNFHSKIFKFIFLKTARGIENL